MSVIAADLHIHSALSPCADDDMTPQAIVYAAIVAELNLIALCDHNCAANTAAVQEAAQSIAGDLIGVIAGMEITTSEEAHIIALFPDATRAMSASNELAERLPSIPVDARYGRQLIMDAADNIVGELTRLLSFATELDLNRVVDLIHRHDGLAVAAHVDRPSCSVISQLGILPADARFDALELSAAGLKQGREKEFTDTGHHVITSSDAHFLPNIGDARTLFEMNAPTFAELACALKDKQNRRYRLA